VPAAIKSLAAHFGDGDPASWRAALRVFEQAFGRPIEVVEEHDPVPSDPFKVAEMSQAQRDRLVSRVLDRYPHPAELAPVELRPRAVEAEPE